MPGGRPPEPEVGYRGAHHRARKSLEQEPCAHCGATENVQAALRHDGSPSARRLEDGRAFSIEAEDYLALCPSCHSEYDGKERSEPAESKPKKKPGRPRKYASHAERQAAYRARKAGKPEPPASAPVESVAEPLPVKTVSPVIASVAKRMSSSSCPMVVPHGLHCKTCGRTH